VDVRVVEAGENDVAAQVDRARGAHAVEQGVVADGDDASAAHRDGLGDAEAIVDGDDLAAIEEEVDRLGRARCLRMRPVQREEREHDGERGAAGTGDHGERRGEGHAR